MSAREKKNTATPNYGCIWNFTPIKQHIKPNCCTIFTKQCFCVGRSAVVVVSSRQFECSQFMFAKCCCILCERHPRTLSLFPILLCMFLSFVRMQAVPFSLVDALYAFLCVYSIAMQSTLFHICYVKYFSYSCFGYEFEFRSLCFAACSFVLNNEYFIEML